MSNLPAEIITRYMQEYTGKHCLFVPSGRIALYLAFKCFLKPGDSILMSPVNDDVIFFTVLAAGLRPLMAPLSDRDGNIDPARIPESTWRQADAIMTTNLHGFPDRVMEIGRQCKRHDLLFIEDAAHAFGIEVEGRPVGSFGQVSAFSFSKIFKMPGGALCFDDEGARDELQRLAGQTLRNRSAAMRIDDAIRPTVLQLLDALKLRQVARSLRDRLNPEAPDRELWRMDLRAEELRQALAETGLEAFESWVEVDGESYRTWQAEDEIRRLADKLLSADIDRDERLRGQRSLAALAVAPEICREMESQAVLRVPLLVQDRDRIAHRLNDHGIDTFYIYDPPLDDYAGPEFATPSPSPRAARWWARHVLPINSLDAAAFLKLVETRQVELSAPDPVPAVSRKKKIEVRVI